MKKLFIMLMFIACLSGIYAQVAVEIVNYAEDTVGRTLVTKFRDIIRKSPAYVLTYSSTEAHFVVQISTMDKYKGDTSMEGVATIYNYTILVKMPDGYSIYCYSQLGYAGKSLLDETAYGIYSSLDEFVESFNSYILE